jgi:hypothetical protein
VRLAVCVAHHSARGRDDAALPHNLRTIGRLLQLTPPIGQRLLLEIDSH